MYVFPLSLITFRVSGIFQKLSSDAYVLCDFLGCCEEPPSGKQCAARRHISDQPNFWVFGMNCLAVLNTRQATRASLLELESVGVLGGVWLGKTVALNINWWLDAYRLWITCEWRLKLMKLP